jgi:hypothetical protein
LKKAGIRAKGTGQFSVRLEEDGKKEIPLGAFWARYAKNQNPSEFDTVVAEAKKILGQ